MDQFDKEIGNKVNNFCKVLPYHVDKWNALLQNAIKSITTLFTYAEQLYHIQKATNVHLENFIEVRESIVLKIYQEMEEEYQILRKIIEQLNVLNCDIRNKLALLEKLAVKCKWDSCSQIIAGNAFYPPLQIVLRDGFSFLLFFMKTCKVINIHLKSLNVNKKMIEQMEKSFTLDLDNKIVTDLLSKTQYI